MNLKKLTKELNYLSENPELHEGSGGLQFVKTTGKDVTRFLTDYLTGKIDRRTFERASGLSLGFKNQVKLTELDLENEADDGRGAVFPKDHPLHDPNFPGIESPQGIVVNGKEVDRSSIVIDGVTPAWGPDDGTSDAYPEEAFFVDGTELSQEELEELEENYRDDIYELAMEQYFQGEGVTQDEGSCGYAPNGEVDQATQPAGPHLIRIKELIKKEIRSLKEAAGAPPIDNKKFYYIRDKKNNEVLHRGPLTAKSAQDEMKQYREDNSVMAVADQYNKTLWLPGYTKGPKEKNTKYPDSPNALSV